MRDHINIFDIRINKESAQSALRKVERFILSGHSHKVYIANAHTLNIAYEDPYYKSVLKSADFILNDGTGLNWAAKRAGDGFLDNLVGTDFVPKLCEAYSEKGYGFYFLGAHQGIAELAAKKLKESCPALRIVGFHHGYFSKDENQQIIDAINNSYAHVLLVGFGNPKQEIWIHENIANLNVGVAIGVGAFFDYHSGRLRRAPKWMLRYGMEWIFRLSAEPRRLWKRYVMGNPKFIFRVLRYYRFSGNGKS